MDWRNWRTIGVAAFLPVAVLIGVIGPVAVLPKKGGVYAAVGLLVLGIVFGLRAIALVLVTCIVTFLGAKTRCLARGEDDCNLAYFWLTLVPLAWSLPVALGAALWRPLARFASRFAGPS